MKQTHPIVQAALAEHIELPGAPQIIVTRIWAYTWLRDELGFDPSVKGFGSIDFMAFGRPQTREPLTDLNQEWVKSLLAFMVRTENPHKGAA